MSALPHTASTGGYDRLLTTFGLAFPRLARMGRLSGTFATPFDLVFPKREYSTIWWCFWAEIRVKKVGHAINSQVATIVCVPAKSVDKRPLKIINWCRGTY